MPMDVGLQTVTTLSRELGLVVLADARLTAGLGRGAQHVGQPLVDVGPEVAAAARDGGLGLGVFEELDEDLGEEVAIPDRRSHAIGRRARPLHPESLAARPRKPLAAA